MYEPRSAGAYRTNPCPNLNHRRADAPVAHCPQCGGTVNASLHTSICTDSEHAVSRRQQSAYCVRCGLQLIAGR